MEQLKGLYFSLDSLLASLVLIASASLVLGYTSPPQTEKKPLQLDKIHTASIQKVSDWNSSIDSGRTVMGYIYVQHHENPSEVAGTCGDYFNYSRPYALYFSNSTHREKVCGSYNPGESDSVTLEESLTPDVPVNSTFEGPSKAVMVIND